MEIIDGTELEPKRKKPGTFEKGNDGRPPGSLNKTTKHLKEAMLLAAAELGDLSGIKREDLYQEGIEQGKGELVGYLKWLGKVEPKSFASCG